MFTHHCSACDRTQLIFFSQMTSVVGTDGSAKATFTCWCGAEQSSEISLLSTASAPVSPVLVTV